MVDHAPEPGRAPETPGAEPLPGLDIGRLTAEAASRSGMLWIRLPDGDTHPVWHVWHEDGAGSGAYVVSGTGEQPLPPLPDEVEVILRSKDSGGRLLTLRATATALAPDTPAWVAAVAHLTPARLNATDDLESRWRESCTVHVLTPHGAPHDEPGMQDGAAGARPVRPAAPATARWRPWHWRGRAGARRNTAR